MELSKKFDKRYGYPAEVSQYFQNKIGLPDGDALEEEQEQVPPDHSQRGEKHNEKLSSNHTKNQAIKIEDNHQNPLQEKK